MNRHARLLAARVLRGAGLFFMVASAFGGLLLRASASPAVWPHIHVGFDVGVIAVPSASPAPGVTPHPAVARRGGPMTVNVSGSLTLGERLSQSSQGNQAANQSTGNVGMLAELGRRTSNTSLRLAIPAGVSGRISSFGELQAEYSTPRYALLYGSQGVSALGGLPLGATLRGLTLTLPIRNGEVSLYSGPAFGLYGSMMHVNGVRARALVRGQLVELGYSRAWSPEDQTSISSLIFGVAATTQRLNVIFEGAIQRATLGNGETSTRPSYSLRGDYGAGESYASLTLRHIGESFVSVGSGFVQSENFASIGLRRQVGANGYSIDEGVGRSGTGFSAQAQRRGGFTFTHSSTRSGAVFQLSAVDQRVATENGATWAGGLGFNTSFMFRRTTLLGSIQAQRSVSTFSDPVSTMQYQLQMQRPFGRVLLQTGYEFSRQTTPGLSTGTTTATASLSRIFGRTGLSFGGTYARAQTPLSDIVTFTPLVQISRRISPSITLGMYGGVQVTRDRLNPGFNAHSRVFNISLTSPFSLGSGHITGGGNPRLPATISGSVLKDSNGFSTNSAAISDGIPNVVVVLDNEESQRTDLSGRFSFQFIKPGRHEVRLETASLPRGVTADQPVFPLDLEGGQEGQVYFRVGAFGAVQGHVMGRDASGALTPLEAVALKMDDAQNTATSQYGGFGFGRLTAGKHTVKIIVESLPASVSFGGEATKTVEVRTGEISSLDFITDPLGSIEGKVVFDDALADHRGGVLNAYVIANPGDHAAITNDDGSYVLDNLPAGTYTLEVDQETLPEETGVVSGPQSVQLTPSEHHQGADFTIGHKLKSVVFSLHQDVAPAAMTLSQTVVPPLGATIVRVIAPFDASSVTVSAFGKTMTLLADGSKRRFRGLLVVPATAPAGPAEITAAIEGSRHTEASAAIKVDNTMPVATVSLQPSHPVVGQFVRVRARFLANVKPGDTIQWQDGTKTRLNSPISGRVFEFSVKVNLFPMRGFLLIGGSKLPIILR